MANATLTPEVADVIRRSTVTGNLLVLPPGHLPFYAKVKKALELAGGKWKTNKQGFVFDSDPLEKLGLALERGHVVDEKKARQAFYTPPSLAAEVVAIAGVSGLRVLEPSMGDGALAFECLAQGAKKVTGIEIKEEEFFKVMARGGISGWRADFLALEPPSLFDRVVMNPPFTKGQDLKHVTHAKKWLAAGGKLFAIVPDKDCPKFAKLGAVTVKRFSAGAFKESGTSVATRLICIENAA